MDRRQVQLDHLVQNVAEAAYEDLKILIATLSSQSSDSDVVQDPARALLMHLHATRQRLVKLHILLQWCHKAPAMAECKRIIEVCASHIAALKDTASQLGSLSREFSGPGFVVAPSYDVPTAMHVLNKGSRSGFTGILPSIIEEGLKYPKIKEKSSDKQKEMQRALNHMEYLVREKLVHSLSASLRCGSLKRDIEVVSVSNHGETVLCSSSGQWTATLSLVPAPSDATILTKWNQRDAGMATGAASQHDDDKEEKEDGEEGKESERWRWRLLSYRLLPEMTTVSDDCLPHPLADWLQRNLEDRMWAAADIDRLLHKYNMPHLVTVPNLIKAPSKTAVQTSQSNSDVGNQASGFIPDWCQSPLSALHAVLQQASGSLAVGMVLAEQARDLESGDWKDGRLKRLEGATFQIWSDVETADNEMHGYTIHIGVSREGNVTCHCDPPISGCSEPLSVWQKPGFLSLEHLLNTVARQASLLHLTRLKEDVVARFSDDLDKAVGKQWSLNVLEGDRPTMECALASSVQLLMRHDLKTGKLLYIIGNDVVKSYPEVLDATRRRWPLLTAQENLRNSANNALTVKLLWSDVCSYKRKVMIESVLETYRTAPNSLSPVFKKAKLPMSVLCDTNELSSHVLTHSQKAIILLTRPAWSNVDSRLATGKPSERQLACFVVIDCSAAHGRDVTIIVCWVTRITGAVIGVRKRYAFRLQKLSKDLSTKSVVAGKRKRSQNDYDGVIECIDLSDAEVSFLWRRCLKVLLLEHLIVQCESAGWGCSSDLQGLTPSEVYLSDSDDLKIKIYSNPDGQVARGGDASIIATVQPVCDDVENGGYEILDILDNNSQDAVNNLPIKKNFGSSESNSIINVLLSTLNRSKDYQ